MNHQSFSLHPFPPAPQQITLTSSLLDLKIQGKIARLINTLTINYVLLGDLEDIAIAAPSDSPTRQHNLWEETCFEFFLGLKDSERYWEFNLSPAGHWNVYRFDGYRQGMQEESVLTTLPFSVQTSSDALSLSLQLDLTAMIPAEQSWVVAIATVLKSKIGEVTYWALTHPGSEADFHRRDSFIQEL
jgi:hypothetical protein